MREYIKAFFVLALLALCCALFGVVDAQGQAAPTLTTITPANVIQSQAATVTISGKGFKSGMLVLWGNQQKALLPHLVNQFKATVALDAATTKDAGFFTVSLLNKNGLQSNVVTVQVCQQLAIVQEPALFSAWSIGLRTEYQLKLTGGCIY